MSVNWKCPVEIPGGVAQGLQCILSGMDSWTLTEANVEEFVRRNEKAKVLMWFDDETGTRIPCTLEQMKPLIGFSWS